MSDARAEIMGLPIKRTHKIGGDKRIKIILTQNGGWKISVLWPFHLEECLKQLIESRA